MFPCSYKLSYYGHISATTALTKCKYNRVYMFVKA